MGERLRVSVQPSERVQPKERMVSDARVGDLLAAFGNHEGKALLAVKMALSPQKRYRKSVLYQSFQEIGGVAEGWGEMDRTNPWHWARTLFRFGLLAKEHDGIGLTYGMPRECAEVAALAGILLDFSLAHPDLSLYDLFRKTQYPLKPSKKGEEAPADRPPLTRLKIFRALLEEEFPMREVDLASALGKSQKMLSKHLIQLSEGRIITYDATVQNTPYSYYRLALDRPSDNPPYYKRAPSLAQEVYTFLLQHPETPFDTETIVEAFIKKASPAASRDSIMGQVRGILPYLAREGFAAHEGFRSNMRSKITLTSGQRAILGKLVTPIDRFQEGDKEAWEYGRARARELLHSPEATATLMKKARDTSYAAS